MENPEEILHSLEEFSKMKPKDIPGELEEYLVFVARTGDPIYQWASIKSLFREKLINVITEFYESCPVMEIPPCPNVDIFNYDLMKNFILEKLEAFSSAPFTLQRICELLTTPRKEYNRIDKFMRALEKNILVVSTVEPGGRRSNENGDGIMNGLENEPPVPEPGAEINIEEMDETPSWSQELSPNHVSFETTNNSDISSSNQECIISCTIVGNQPYVSIEPLPTEALTKEKIEESLKVATEKEPVTEQIQIPDTTVSEPDISLETVEVVPVVVVTEAKPQEKSESSGDKNDTEMQKEESYSSESKTDIEMPQEEADVEVSEEMQEDEVSKDASQKEEELTIPKVMPTEEPVISVVKDIPLELEVEKVVEEITTETDEPNRDAEVASEVISQPTGIENISPETSTESPEALEVSTSVQSEALPEETDNVQTEDSTEDVKKTEKTDEIVENSEIVEKSKVLEEAKEDLSQDRGDVKIDVDTLESDTLSEDLTANISDNVEKVCEIVKENVETEAELVKEENIEIINVQVEPMIVTESSDTEKPSEVNQEVEKNNAIEVDPLKIDHESSVEQKKDEQEIISQSEPSKTETLQPEESTPMEVDITETKCPEEVTPQKDPSVDITDEKEPEPNQTESDS